MGGRLVGVLCLLVAGGGFGSKGNYPLSLIALLPFQWVRWYYLGSKHMRHGR